MDVGESVKFSLLCPTRGRAAWTESVFRTLMDNADNVGSFEVLFMYDTDDAETERALFECKSKYPIMKARLLSRVHDDNLSDGYYNWGAAQTHPQSRYLWAVGNDIKFWTPGWDAKTEAAIEEYLSDKPDRIALAFAQDKYPTDKGDIGFEWGCFPILTRETYRALGWFFPKEFITWEADVIMARLFHELDRMLIIGNVIIDQISYHAYNIPKDEVAWSMKARHNLPGQGSIRNAFKQKQLPLEIARMREVIRNGRMEQAEPV